MQQFAELFFSTNWQILSTKSKFKHTNTE